MVGMKCSKDSTNPAPGVSARLLTALCLAALTCGPLGAQDGTPEAGFNPAVSGTTVNDIIVQPDGKILIGGIFTSAGGQVRNRIARLNADGTLDASFNPNANNYVVDMALQPNGQIVVGGGFTNIGGSTRNRIARVNSDGTLDPAFNPNSDGDVNALAIQSDGKILVGGNFTEIAGDFYEHLVRLNPNGSSDNSFNFSVNVSNTVHEIVVQPDGKIIVAGDFVGGRIKRLNANGNTDTSFSPGTGANNSIRALVLQPDGKVLIGGFFTTVDGQPRNFVARLNADGSLDNTFITAPGPDSNVWCMALQPNGKILIGGQIKHVDGAPRAFIARLNPDGSIDSSFDTGTPVPTAVLAIHSMALQPDEKILVGGNFSGIGTTSIEKMARLDNTFTFPPTFTTTEIDTATAGTAYSYVAQADGTPAPTLSAPVLPSWLNFNPATGELSGTPGAADIGTTGNDVVLEAANSDGTATQSFTINVSGTAPFITSSPSQFATIGMLYSETIAVTGLPAPTLTDQQLPGWLSFNPTTGVLSGTPGAGDLGTTGNDVEIQADNGWGTDTLTFNIQVNGVAPVIVTSATMIAVAGQPYSYTVAATGNPAPTFNVSGLPAWLNFDNVNRISGTPQATDIGLTGAITITASNGQAPNDIEVFHISVQGRPPMIVSVPFTTATVGAPYSYTVVATGVPAPTLAASGLPSWLSFNPGTGELTGTPTTAGLAAPITITAGNGWGADSVQAFSIMITEPISIENGRDSGNDDGCTTSEGSPALPSAVIALGLIGVVYLRQRKRRA